MEKCIINISDIELAPIDVKFINDDNALCTSVNDDNNSISNEIRDQNQKHCSSVNGTDLQITNVANSKNSFEPIYKHLYNVDSDSLTSYYLLQYFLNEFPQREINSWHSGISNDSFLRGMFLCVKQQNLSWEFNGVDKSINQKYAFTEFKNLKNVNVLNLPMVKKLNQNMSEKLNFKSINFATYDIKINNANSILYHFALTNLYCVDNCMHVFRLPNVLKLIPTVLIMLFFISEFKYVKLFKTPWGVNSKIYLITYGKKEETTHVKINKLYKFLQLSDTVENVNLYKSEILEEFIIQENISLIKTVLEEIYTTDLSKCFTHETAMDVFTNL